MRKKSHNPNVYKRKRRHMSIRNRVIGTPARPRACVFRSSEHIYVQVIDDTTGNTVTAVSSLKVDRSKLKTAAPKGKGKGEDGEKKAAVTGKKLQAYEVGRLLAEAMKARGINKIAFDRGGYLYHGRVAVLAEAAREHGLEF